MNRRYIDFVPHQSASKGRSEKPAADDDFDTTETLTYEQVEITTVQPPIKVRRFDDFIAVPVKKKRAKVKVEEPAEEFEEPVEEFAEPTEEEFAEPIIDTEVNDAPLDQDLTIEEIMMAREEEDKNAKTFESPDLGYGFGIIEDYTPVDNKRPAFINAAQVEKRPLSGSREEVKRSDADLEDELKVAKSEDLTKRKIDTEKAPEAPKPVDREFKKPKFINTHLIEKRPLSKTDYRNRVPVANVEESTASPITIIDKPEKDSRLGFIITVIITILLGAAVGTVAFLLIPH